MPKVLKAMSSVATAAIFAAAAAAGHQQPGWPPTYNLSLSTMTFPDGNHSGFASAERAALDARYGLITFGWEMRVCLTAAVSDPRGACANAKGEWSIDEQAARIKAINPHTRIFHYRNTMLSLSSFGDQCPQMYDPQYAGFFLRAAGSTSTGRLLNTPADPRSLLPCLPAVLPPSCRLPWSCPQVNQDQFYRDFTNQGAADHFVNTVIGRVASSSHADGVWFDDVGGVPADVRHADQVLKGFTLARLQQIQAATNATVIRAERLLNSKGKWAFNSFRRLPAVTNASVEQCVSALQAGAAIGATNVPSLMYIPYFVPAKSPTTEHDFQQLLAAFLLVRGEYSWFGHGWLAGQPPVWYPEWDVDVGVPLGPMQRNGASAFTRKWSKGSVALDCSIFKAKLEFPGYPGAQPSDDMVLSATIV